MDLIKSISIENTVAKRDAAVAKLRQLFADVDQVDDDLAKLCGRWLREIVYGRDCLLFAHGGVEEAIRVIDADIWAKLLLESGLRSFMSSKARGEWDANIMNRNVPELTLDNVRATFAQMYAERGEMFTDGVVAVFRSLSWDYKTNSPLAFGPKLILSGLWTDKGAYLSHDRCHVLDDLVRALHILDGKPEPDVRNGMWKRISDVQRKADVLEDAYFMLRWYRKAGTAHVTFKRQDLVDGLNIVLGSRFPDAIATDIRNPVHRPKAMPLPGARRIGQMALDAMKLLKAEGSALVGLPPLERLIYEEVDRVLTCLGGRWDRVRKGHVFDGISPAGLPYVLSMLLRDGRYYDWDDFGFFPTPPEIVEILIELAELESGMTVLEPSAGRGAIVERLLAAGCKVTAIEALPVNADHLRDRFGLAVIEGDFLETSVNRVEDLFSAIVMNPPFSKHQDIAHVMHATHFLKPGGRLVAVMSAGVKFNGDKYSKQFREYVAEHGKLIDLPAGSFKASGTSVNTVVAVLTKPDPSRQIAASKATAQQPAGQLSLV
ncbi:DUF4942 domain-containing protein [Rubrivivax gelatinosus]|uniref:DUF4942 domain-containing protein n=1 Tax=Rubrivivax gelatinosus TaxID=28068 RepID=UPI00030A91D6|nr:DUF4942 domain-containing protein [Rubrivivax gelatinosus]MBG6083041.1 putative RNA methylase [Rubrivivax gelatinosus]